MFHFSNAKVNTCCNSSVPCTEADSCCSRSQENTVLALIMDAIISIIMGLRLTALVILSVIIISIIISTPVPLGMKRNRC